jgi:hypothetical protein
LYIARKIIKGKIHYFIRESYPDGDYLKSRDLFDLGTDPAEYIIYPGGSAFYISEVVEERLRFLGIEPDVDELDEIFLKFVDPEIRRTIERFDRKERTAKRPKINEDDEKKLQAKLHPFDKRRIHYLRCGRLNQGRLEFMPYKLFRVLYGKSRDEIEQYLMEMEESLDASELKTYTYVIFDLQKFFSEKIAKRAPQYLDQHKVDACFIEEICRLNSGTSFWAGMPTENKLHEYLARYVVMYFDNEYGRSTLWEDYIRDFMKSRRYYRPPSRKNSVEADEAITIFGITKGTFRRMTRKGLVRRYRRLAQQLHPDKGGKHDDFIQLTKAYHELLKLKK